MRVRYEVTYVNGDGLDDWQLLNTSKEYFDTKESAEVFAETKKIKNKEFYWQPRIRRQEEHVFSYPKWIEA